MTLRRMIAWAKMIGIVAVILFVLLFMIANRDPVRINFLFAKTPELPKFVLIVTSANLGVLVFLITSRIRRVLADMRESRHERQVGEPPGEDSLPDQAETNSSDNL